MKADIFFFVSTIAVVLVSAAVIVGICYLVRALEQARKALREVEEHAEDVGDEVRNVLVDLRESALYRFLFRRKKKQLKNGEQNEAFGRQSR